MATRFYLALQILLLVGVAGGGMKVVRAAAADTSKCAQVLVALTPCLAYVQGTAQLPSKTCCTSVLPLHTNNPQCLCALIVAASEHDPKLPANLNLTLALSLGPACNIPTDPSRCPDLLGLSPDSPEAKIFTTVSSASNSTSTGAETTPPASTSSTPSTTTKQPTSSLGQSDSSASSLFLDLFYVLVLSIVFSVALF